MARPPAPGRWIMDKAGALIVCFYVLKLPVHLRIGGSRCAKIITNGFSRAKQVPGTGPWPIDRNAKGPQKV